MLTGMRQGEVFGLRRQDVDLDSKRITATHVLYRGQLLRGLKKHKRARKARQHHVLIPEMMDVVLRDHMESSPFHGPQDFLFHKDDGSALDPDVFRNDVLYPALGQVGIPIRRRGSGFHMFRHYRSLADQQRNREYEAIAGATRPCQLSDHRGRVYARETQRKKAAEALERGILGNL